MLSEQFFKIFYFFRFHSNNTVFTIPHWSASHIFIHFNLVSGFTPLNEQTHQIQMLEFWMYIAHCTYYLPLPISTWNAFDECGLQFAVLYTYTHRHRQHRMESLRFLFSFDKKAKTFIVSFEYSFMVHCSYRSIDRFTIQTCS